MRHTTGGLKTDPPTSLLESPHQLHLFVVEEETLVEEADFTKRLLPEHHACACRPIYLDRSGSREILTRLT
jgi:hypothetical protein